MLGEIDDNQVLEWIYERHEKRLRVSYTLIMKKAKVIYEEIGPSKKSEYFEVCGYKDLWCEMDFP